MNIRVSFRRPTNCLAFCGLYFISFIPYIHLPCVCVSGWPVGPVLRSTFYPYSFRPREVWVGLCATKPASVGSEGSGASILL